MRAAFTCSFLDAASRARSRSRRSPRQHLDAIEKLVRTDRKLRTSCQEEGSARSRKDGKVQRGLHSQSNRHRDAEECQQNSAQQGSGARAPSNRKAEAQQAFRARCNDGQSRNQALRQKPVELSRVHHESRESSPRHVGPTESPPQSEPVGHGGKEGQAESKPQKQ